MSRKYIFANIRLPIEILEETGSFHEVFSDRMTIDFELCRALPEPTSYENKELIAKILAIHHNDRTEEKAIEEEDEEEEEEEEEEEDEEEEVKILKPEFLNKSSHNMSFKKRTKTNHNKFTKKRYR